MAGTASDLGFAARFHPHGSRNSGRRENGGSYIIVSSVSTQINCLSDDLGTLSLTTSFQEIQSCFTRAWYRCQLQGGHDEGKSNAN